MKYIYEAHDLADISQVGGKGHHLQKLVSWDAEVAPFFVISTSASEKVDPEVKKHIENFLKLHPRIVFRSSMIGEDHLDASFAGLFETILGVESHNWEESLAKIYASLNSSRVQSYISQKNIQAELKMAVVVQKEIQVDKSGVLFTRAPIQPTSAIAIDAALGMGEGVVSGLVDIDHYLISRLGETIEGLENKVLLPEELKQLVKESLRLEKIFQSPADIEWGFQKGKIYIFQIRPITRNFSPLNVFADTNLTESYPGAVSPFTASFVRRAYENVFIEAAHILGYEKSRIKLIQDHCAKLVCAVDDHMYYHIEHYYAVLRSLPGGEKNIENWHKMIGGKVEGAEVAYHDTKLSNFDLVNAVFRLVSFAKRKKNIYAKFLIDLDQLSLSIKEEMKGLKTSDQTIKYLCHLMERPLGFGLTIVNDFFIMIGLGLLTTSLKKKGLNEDLIIDLLHTSQSLDSVKPLTAFNQLVSELSEGFMLDFEKMAPAAGFSPYEEVFKNLREKWPNDVHVLKRFISEYGDRSFEELKLESLPLKNDPDLLVKLLKWGKQNKSMNHQQKKAATQVSLGFIDVRVLKFTRECIEFRETTRLWRGRFYHFLRLLVIQLAGQLIKENPRFSHYGLKDFFSVNHHEWKLFSEKKMSVDEVCVLMDSRKWQNKSQTYPEFVCWAEEEKLPQFKVSSHTSGELKGQGVSPGIIEATALVLESPTEILGEELDNFILVTKNTDPAWIYIMSRSKGLISEKGSMLSHTAIIGRELGIPTLVGVKNATHQIKTGDKLRIDGSTGEVKIL
jgi:phosphohistidine swiveling domain-containing protein